jgi:signal transduction histidine kinase
MEAVQEAGQRHAFLSTKAAHSGEKRLARYVVAVALLGFIGTLPFVRLPLARIPPFSPGYEAALCVSDLLTMMLLFNQFARLRSRALLLLAAGYLFDALMICPLALSFPGVFSANGLMGAGPQTTTWLYVFWHCGFPLFVLGYALLARRPIDIVTGSPGREIGFAVAGVVSVAMALTLLTTAGHGRLPVVIQDGNYARLVTIGVGPATLGLSVTVLLVLWRRSVPTVLELWLMVAMVTWVLDITLSTVVTVERVNLGFYAGRLFGLLSASVVLAVLLFEMNRLYAKVSDALALAEIRNVELARSREEFARIQRFEAIGQLVGGVAHDFNNLLTVITGALDLTLQDPSLPPKTRTLLDMSMTAAHRGAALTGQLLTFARKQVLQPEIMNPNEVIAGLETFMARSTGEKIVIVTALSPVLWPARLDRAQFETALVNLVVNARDALGGEGRILISTQNTVADAGAVADMPAGDYVVVSVTDSGTGMTQAVIARAIEPFFTTKEIGKGSGLGLSQVYGFVRAASGYLRIESEPGQGTAVRIYLPKSSEYPPQAKPPGLLPIRATQGDATILVVEDEPDVLNVAVSFLAGLGYKVKIATNAQEAMDILQEDKTIDVLFSDVVMPGGMDGAQLAVQARRRRPGLKILLTSGYTALGLSENHGLSDRLDVLQKPYRHEELATKLRQVIGR